MIYTKDIIKAKALDIAQTTQYIASGVIAIIDKFTVTNTSGNSVSLNVHLVPDGDSPSINNIVVFNRTIGIGETYTFPEIVGHVLSAGSYISTKANDVGLNIRASGREIS